MNSEINVVINKNYTMEPIISINPNNFDATD